MLTAYVDESGQEGDDYVFLAGFLGDAEAWAKCAVEWKRALGKRPHLHMKKLRWSRDSTRRFLATMGPIPRSCGLQGILGGVRVSDYADLVAGSLAERLLNGYIQAMFPMVINVLHWIPSGERVEFVFEEQQRYEHLASLALSAFVNITPEQAAAIGVSLEALVGPDGKSKISNWKHVPKGSTILTEPADYLVYSVAQWYKDKNSVKSRWCLPIIENEKSNAVGGVLTRAQARGAAAFALTVADAWKTSRHTP